MTLPKNHCFVKKFNKKQPKKAKFLKNTCMQRKMCYNFKSSVSASFGALFILRFFGFTDFRILPDFSAICACGLSFGHFEF